MVFYFFLFSVLLIEESYIVSLCIHCEIHFVHWYYCVSFLEPFTSLNGCFPKDTFSKSKFLSFNIVHGNAHWKSELALPSNLSFLWAGLNMPAGCASCWDGLLFHLLTFWSVHVVNSALYTFWSLYVVNSTRTLFDHWMFKIVGSTSDSLHHAIEFNTMLSYWTLNIFGT